MAQPDWEAQVLQMSRVEKVFLTNDFDDTLSGFDTNRYVPCLRTDDLVFHLANPVVRGTFSKKHRDRSNQFVADQGWDRETVQAFFVETKRELVPFLFHLGLLPLRRRTTRLLPKQR